MHDSLFIVNNLCASRLNSSCPTYCSSPPILLSLGMTASLLFRKWETKRRGIVGRLANFTHPCLALWRKTGKKKSMPCSTKRREYYLATCYPLHWTFVFFAGDDGESSDSSWNMECNQVLRVKSIYISSAILAAKSPFFYKVILICASNEFIADCRYVLYLANHVITFILLAFLKWHERIRSEACNS